MAGAMHERQESSSVEFPLWEVDGKSFWNALAKQAEANLMQAGANLKQAEANLKQAKAILSQGYRATQSGYGTTPI